MGTVCTRHGVISKMHSTYIVRPRRRESYIGVLKSEKESLTHVSYVAVLKKWCTSQTPVYLENGLKKTGLSREFVSVSYILHPTSYIGR